jgi:hypothetical protein
MNFFRVKHAGYSLEFPLPSVSNVENLFKSYDAVILCGGNVALADPKAKTRYVFYGPTSFIELEPAKISEVYLNPYDKYGCNRQWEKALSGCKEKLQYLP